MTTDLSDHQFEIMFGAESPNGYVFGLGAPLAVEASGFKPGEPTWYSQDTVNTRNGVTMFGRDTKGTMTWTWDAFTNGADEASALSIYDDIAGIWGMKTVYGRSLQMQRLRYSVAGRTRCIYGRPRKMGTTPTNLILGGLLPVTMEFITADSLTYSDDMHSVSLGYTSTVTGGGIQFPVTFPIETVPSDGVGQGSVVNAGNANTYPIIRFRGPWNNPSIKCDAWTLKWSGSIPAGDYIEIDTRPWAQTVEHANGASAMSGMSPTIWLEDCFLRPGETDFVMGGASSGSTAQCEVLWRDAWSSW